MSGSRATGTNFQNRRPHLKADRRGWSYRSVRAKLAVCTVLFSTVQGTAVAQTQGPVKITLDEAVQMALQHNHNMLAARTTIQQSEAEETTANLRPNPTLFADWEYLPLGSPSKQNPNLYPGVSTNDYLKNNTEAD